jgi:glucosamine-6-phosphate deaminase
MISTTIEAQQRERIPTEVYESADEACARLAGQIADLIAVNDHAGRNTVLGLATGSTPVRLYRELIRLHRGQKLSFRRVFTFNLDEYYGLPPSHPESYWRFMHEQLFDHVDIPLGQIHVPDGLVPRANVFEWCQHYEEKIRNVGGLDLQILGVGRTGHIGFNEPGSSQDSRTRLVTLDGLTRRDAARDFGGETNVPRHAITMGVGTVLAARKVVLLAWGDAKAGIVSRAIEQPVTETLPASFLQRHSNVRFLLDRAAAAELTRARRPWLVGSVQWTPEIVRRAVVWLASETGKPVLKLLDEDYSEYGMADLLTQQGPAYGLNIRIFNELQRTITGWPGGKPHADDSSRPERAAPSPKRVVVFSPEPAHDVIGMGGTLRRLLEHGNEVTVVYLTSGNLASPDDEALLVADMLVEFTGAVDPKGAAVAHACDVRQQLGDKPVADTDTAAIRHLKGLLRRSEARAAMKDCGLSAEHVQFLDLGFYERGRYRQFQPDDSDVASVLGVLRKIKPHQIFATGTRDDPSSISSVCFGLIRQACSTSSADPWFTDCRIWLYRGVDGPWEMAEVDMAVPLSPRELGQKARAVFRHRSQRIQTPTTPELRETWQQAEQHNRDLAVAYDRLGLAQYEAIEAFQRWRGGVGPGGMT